MAVFKNITVEFLGRRLFVLGIGKIHLIGFAGVMMGDLGIKETSPVKYMSHKELLAFKKGTGDQSF